MIANRNAMPLAPHDVLVDKTCFQCGQPFRGRGFIRKCEQCRKPARAPRARAWNEGCVRGKPLSPREKQLVQLIGEGCANKEIAYRLKLSEGTVKVYFSKLFRKLGVDNRLNLVIWSLSREGGATPPG